MNLVFAIAMGGALGAVLRHYSNSALLALVGSAFPIGILSVNIAGSFFMGVAVSLFALGLDVSQTLKAFLTVGVLGGFTTFSAFSLDSVLMIERGQYAAAALYITLSVFLSILALVAGMALARILYSGA